MRTFNTYFGRLAGGFLLALIFFSSCREETKPQALAIMSYNIRNCLGMDGITDYQRVANIITAVGADVVALQELDSATQRSGGVVVLDELAARTGMFAVYGPAISFQGGQYGVGILSNEKPVSWENIPLPGSEEPRTLLVVEFEKYVVCCTHFSLTQNDRLTSTEIIRNVVGKYSKPVFLAGDINDLPGSEVLVEILKDWQMLSNPGQPTYRSDKPERCIDYIFALKGNNYDFRVMEAVVGNEPLASDHRPLWVRLKIEKVNQ